MSFSWSKRTSFVGQVHLKPLLASGLLTSHWPKQVTWSSTESRRGKRDATWGGSPLQREMAKGRVKPPGRPCSLLQLCNINHSTSPTWKEPWSSNPTGKIGVSFARSSLSLLPSMDCATHTLGYRMAKVPHQGLVVLSCSWVPGCGRQAFQVFSGEPEKGQCRFPLTPNY